MLHYLARYTHRVAIGDQVLDLKLALEQSPWHNGVTALMEPLAAGDLAAFMAMGRPAWLALNPVPDWRWMLDRSDSPWYPSVRLFRQPRPGPWAPVFEAMAAALAPSLPAR